MTEPESVTAMTEGLKTPLTDLLDITAPVVQAPISDLVRPQLVAAVSNAGGLGVHPFSGSEPATLDGIIAETRALTAKPFAVNLALYLDQDERLGVCLDAGVALVSFFWGDSSPLVGRVHAAGAKAMQTVASADETKRAVDAGVDVIVAQGWEAGGHVRSEVGSMALIPAVVDAAGDVPVIAAGGIADGRGLAAALMLGAAGVWMGTRFVASREAVTHPGYLDRLVEARENETEIGTLFDLDWPDAPHRTLRNSTIEAWRAAGSPPSGARPGEGEPVAAHADGSPILRYESEPPANDMTGDWEAMTLFAGQGVALVGDVKPAADIVADTVAEARRLLARWAGET